ncbi:MAG: relaxase/mobilization nuclease domain-containing protein [Pseudomonadota bacterium]
MSAPQQAVLKQVRNGGATKSKSISNQMNYLTRNQELEAERSERYQGITIADREQVAELSRSWTAQAQNGIRGAGDQQMTTHLVASFPPGTDDEKAKEVGRAWADEMFNSGKHGDKWDYVTVFHNDTDHPHMHVVVNRRGLEGDWLKISKRDPHMNYDNMREVLAEVAQEHGLDLEATSREARGLGKDTELTQAQRYMKAREAEREAQRDPELMDTTGEMERGDDWRSPDTEADRRNDRSPTRRRARE